MELRVKLILKKEFSIKWSAINQYMINGNGIYYVDDVASVVTLHSLKT